MCTVKGRFPHRDDGYEITGVLVRQRRCPGELDLVIKVVWLSLGVCLRSAKHSENYCVKSMRVSMGSC